MKRITLILLTALLLVSCGGRTAKKPSQPSRRSFPTPEIPTMISGQQERMDFLALHFWDRFLDPSALYLSDSTAVNGITLEEAEQQMGVFSTLLMQVSPSVGKESMDTFFTKTEAFSLAHPESNVFPRLSDLARKYLYDPNSPVRNEDLYGVYVARQAKSALTPQEDKARFQFEAQLCALNPVGSVATDFSFTDTAGRIRSLHGIKADWLLLIFGNPDCTACRELVDVMAASSRVQALVDEGKLKVVDIFIDREIDAWKAGKAAFPASWICGYDHTFQIRDNLLYSVRGIPSLYLLDKDKKILLKDAPQENVLAALESI